MGSSFNKIKLPELPLKKNIPLFVLVITRSSSDTLSTIVTDDSIASKVDIVCQSQHLCDSCLNLRSLCSEAMSVHARLAKITYSVLLVQRGLHPHYANADTSDTRSSWSASYRRIFGGARQRENTTWYFGEIILYYYRRVTNI